jgi:hypothetical protein
MRMALVVMLAACGAAPHAAVPHVRLAQDNEFPSQLRHDERGLPQWNDCELAGPVDQALYQPLLDYARTQLVTSDTRSGFTPQGLDIHWVGQPETAHPQGIFNWINIDPRTLVGRLSIGQAEWRHGRGVWAMETDYCVHVIDEGGGRGFVLVPGYSIIGSATPTRSYRAAST